jgi:hypothetical protein
VEADVKKPLMLALFVLSLYLLPAVPKYILSLPSSSPQSATPRQAVISLISQGQEVYYYNDRFIILGSDLPVYPLATCLCSKDSGTLYLVSRLGGRTMDLPASAGNILLDLGSSVLLLSSLDAPSLRQVVSAPFTTLDLSPLPPPHPEAGPAFLESCRIDILSLISHVSADSIQSYIQTLQDFQTRYALADNHWAVANWIKDQYVRFGIDNAYMHDYLWSGTRQFNPVACITGTVFPDIYILIGGHHDSITETNPITYAPGADDNASGAAATLEMARVMMEMNFHPKCSIILTTFSAEEVGHLGSSSYAQLAVADSMDIRLMVNMDMIANNDPGNSLVHLHPYDGSVGHSLTAASITSLYTDLVPEIGNLNETGSDSYDFWINGFNTIFFNENDFSPWWHTDQDIVANLDIAYCTQVVKAVTAVAAVYSNMPLVPENPMIWDTGTGYSLLATWDSPPDPLIDHYNVYVGTSEYDTVFWQSVTTGQCLITGLSEGLTYCVAISSVDYGGNESYTVLAHGTPLSIPRPPVGLIEQPLLHAVSLQWSPNTELDLASYKIFRSIDPADDGECIAIVPSAQNQFTDSGLSGTLAYYSYRIAALDSQGYTSALSAPVLSRPVSLDMGILIIDETLDYNGDNPFLPTDQMVDDFYDSVMSGFNVTNHLDLQLNQQPLRLADIGIYSCILWHGNDAADLTSPAEAGDVLKQYLAYGGNIFFSLYFPSTAFEYYSNYPVTFTPDSFIRDVLGIGSANYSVQARFKYALPAQPAWPSVQVDPQKTIPSFLGHIFRVESIFPEDPADCIYNYGSDFSPDTPQGSLNGQPVGAVHSYGEGKTLLLSFPLYHMQLASSQEMATYAFSTLFNETVENETDCMPKPNELLIHPCRPNPFSTETTLSIETDNTRSPLDVRVYNLRGQLVRTLYSDLPAKRTELIWNAHDDNGRSVASGLYIVRVSQMDLNHSCKVIMIKG